MKRVLIVEDNKTSAEKIRKIVQIANSEADIYMAHNVGDAYEIALNTDMDLLLLDISLNVKKSGDVSGIKFAENIRKVNKYKFIPIIMVTSLEDPKLYAYSEIHCYSYIEKPFDTSKAVEIIREALTFSYVREKNTKYIYKKDGIFYSVELNKVVFVENRNKETRIYTETENFGIPYIAMGELLSEINNDNFVQCSRNCIINKLYIEFVDTTNKYIKLKGVMRQIDIGITYRKEILVQLRNG